MPGLFPHSSGSAEDYIVGDQVKWFINERAISPYVGVVTQVCPGINKVWVDFPIGGNQQKDPTELILITPFVGTSPVEEDTGYDSYDKTMSEENYGTLQDKVKKMAKDMVSREASENRVSKMASKVAGSFADRVVTKLAADVISCIGDGLSDIQTYHKLYSSYERTCSDSFMRSAISKIYNSRNASTMMDMSRYKTFDEYLEGLKTWLGVENLSADRVQEEKKRFENFKKNHPGN